ncbi:hypothetical protein NC653_037412 [Populus alba x Populus x berolinensis]|uniref:NLP1-9 GAF domain-containing protein n=1 Tax=Populus alba x Populus x berolinensis TaxID=444605 RepID=A0AAD6LEA7_9ROSI|nr:hypothetical protein NC653_037412 [Populus alba x Populus x berolinensis]
MDFKCMLLRPSEYSHLSDAISCGVGGIIAFPVLESDQPKYCCAVLELVTMEEKQDFDLETEKGFQALQAADLRINLQPRLRPECFSRDQRAELTVIANVTTAIILLLIDYPLAHHARKYNWNAAVAIWLRGSDADYNYILEFFLPILMKESSEQQDLVRNLKLTPRKTCKSLRMFSKEELLGERGSKVSKNNDKIEPAPDPDDSDDKSLRFREWHKQKDDGDVVDPPKSDLDWYLGEPVETRDKVSDVLAWWSKEWISGSFLVSLNVRSDSLMKQMFKYLVGPFTLSKPMSPEDLKLIQYVLNGRSEFFLRVLVCLAERF